MITRKWADVYTIVTWDQRNCGKSYSKEQNDVALTKDLLLTDGEGSYRVRVGLSVKG